MATTNSITCCRVEQQRACNNLPGRSYVRRAAECHRHRHHPHRPPGKYADAEDGNAYNYFRDYDPTLDRYLQPDPIGQAGGLHVYKYAESNPLRWSDPQGLRPYIDPTVSNAFYAAGLPRKWAEPARPLTLQQRRNAAYVLNQLAAQTALTSTLSGMTPLTAPAVVPFGVLSACSALGSQLIDPDPQQAIVDTVVDIGTHRTGVDVLAEPFKLLKSNIIAPAY